MAEENIEKLLEGYKEDTKRHFDVVAESLKHEIQLVAEGVSTANERIDIIQEDVANIKGDITNIKDTMAVMEVDISTIKIDVEFIKNELIQKVSREEFAFLEKRVSAMETKLHQKT